jgi:tetratricopeptide (TPR) repeat protein
MVDETVEALYDRADLLRRAGHAEAALDAYGQIVKLRPRWADAHLNHGALLADCGRLREALVASRTATQLAPQDPTSWMNLGNAQSRLGRHQEAIGTLKKAVGLQPNGVLSLFNLGNALCAAGRTREAADVLMRAVALDPSFAPAAVNLSSRLRDLGLSDAARDAARLAVQAAPSLPQAWVALGNAFYDLAAFDDAIACQRHALALAADCLPAQVNLALALSAQGKFTEALALNEAVIASAPAMPEPHFGRATCLLALGDFAHGWPAYQARWSQPGAPQRPFAAPLWRGEPPAGQKILIHAEQGLGDTLQFVRFVPQVAARGAKVTLEVQPPLVRLLKTLPNIEVVPRGAKLKSFDLHCPLMDLAGIFAPSLDRLAPASPYLAASPDWIAERPLPATPGTLRVGLVWAGKARADMPHALVMDRRRSVPLTAFAPLCANKRIALFSLQLGPPAEQLKTAPKELVIVDALAGVTDFAETAGVVAQLDLVIAVDTSTAHLAAAMGKPVWLLSRFDSCWRWMQPRTESPWYPTMGIFRQPAPHDWQTPIALMCERLSKEDLLF